MKDIKQIVVVDKDKLIALKFDGTLLQGSLRFSRSDAGPSTYTVVWTEMQEKFE